MSVGVRALVFCLVVACAQKPTGSATVPPAAEAARVAVPEAAAEPVTGSGSGGPFSDPRALYENCRERVEGTETDDECKQDTDCVKTGCSSEMCIAKNVADGVMSTCEVRPCFQVLESCTCQEGHCRWIVGTRKLSNPGAVDGALDVQ